MPGEAREPSHAPTVGAFEREAAAGRWQAIHACLMAEHGEPPRAPPPLGNHLDPTDEAVYIQLTYMTRSLLAVERAFDALRTLVDGDWARLSTVNGDALERAVRPLGLVTRRTENLRSFGDVLSREHEGDLSGLAPLDDASLLEALRALPGLGPKGARCVAAYSFGRDVLAVDVHVLRLAKRLGMLDAEISWARATAMLERQVPLDLRYDLHVLLVQHGRGVCLTRAPRCDDCPLADVCPSAFAAAERRADYVPELSGRPPGQLQR